MEVIEAVGTGVFGGKQRGVLSEVLPLFFGGHVNAAHDIAIDLCLFVDVAPLADVLAVKILERNLNLVDLATAIVLHSTNTCLHSNLLCPVLNNAYQTSVGIA